MSFRVGDHVLKKDGDYRFDGIVMAVFQKRNGRERYAVEDDRGVVLVFKASSLMLDEAFVTNPSSKDATVREHFPPAMGG